MKHFPNYLLSYPHSKDNPSYPQHPNSYKFKPNYKILHLSDYNPSLYHFIKPPLPSPALPFKPQTKETRKKLQSTPCRLLPVFPLTVQSPFLPLCLRQSGATSITHRPSSPPYARQQPRESTAVQHPSLGAPTCPNKPQHVLLNTKPLPLQKQRQQ